MTIKQIKTEDLKKIPFKDLRKALTLMKLKTKNKKDQLFAGAILFKLCSDCRIKVISESIHNRGKPLNTERLCEKCKVKWLDHCEKYKK